VGTGRPRAIDLLDSDVLPAKLEDFPPEDPNGRLFVAYTTICQLLGDLTQELRRKTLTRTRKQAFENTLYRWIKDLPLELRLYQQISAKVLAPYSFRARQLMVTYFVVLLIMYRAEAASDPPSAVSIAAGSMIAGIYEDFLNRNELDFLGPVFAFHGLAAGLTQISACRDELLAPMAEADLSITFRALQELSKRWGSARGITKALVRARKAVSQAPPQTRTRVSKCPENASAFFQDFGPQLCRQWHLVGPSEAITQGAFQVGDIPTQVPLQDSNGLAQATTFWSEHPLFADQADGLDMNAFGGWDPLGSWLLGDIDLEQSF
jgi:hypothetical protein